MSVTQYNIAKTTLIICYFFLGKHLRQMSCIPSSTVVAEVAPVNSENTFLHRFDGICTPQRKQYICGWISTSGMEEKQLKGRGPQTGQG